jgi:hypothetical protein
MAFLEKEELRTVAPVEIVNLVTNNNDTTVGNIIDETIDLMSGYLYEYYDTEAVFNKTETARNLTILKHLKAIVIYEVMKIRRCAISVEIEKAKDEAMNWLERVSEGKIKPPLPVRKTDSNGDGVPDQDMKMLKLGGRSSYKNHW